MSTLATLVLAAMFSTSLVPPPVAGFVAPADADQERAKAMYEEGRRAYRKGHMADAVRNFEAAYDLTENPIVLYNIGLAYRRLYDETRDIAHLRRAKLVLENFKMELARDSGLGSPDEVADVLEEVSSTLDEEENGAPGTPEGGGPEAGDTESTATGEDAETQGASGDSPAEEPAEEPAEDLQEGPEPEVPGDSANKGKVLKTSGYVALGVGGALAITGGVLAGMFLSKRNADLDALDQSVIDAEAAGCGANDNDGLCRDFLDQREALTLRANLNQDRAMVAGLGLGLSGAAAIGGGVALVVIGAKKSKAASGPDEPPAEETARFQVAPWGRGISLTARF